MASTYTLISSQVLTSSASSVTFSSIPATYTDLVLRVSARTDQASSSSYARVTINGTSSGYSETTLDSSGGTIYSNKFNTYGYFGPGNTVYLPGSSNTANTFGSTEFYIPSYTVAQNKPISWFSTTENNATSIYGAAEAGLWSNTAAITSISLLSTNGTTNFITGSSFYLYGIKNS
jgi:hypothetical protein